MASRDYENTSDWTIVNTITINTPNGAARIVRETADIRHRSDRSGHIFRNGRYRVRVVGPGKGYPRTKTFTGETAWSDSERHINDIETDYRYRH